MYFNWISTASFVALNKRGVKNVFQLHYRQYKIDTASVYNDYCFPAWSNRPFLKRQRSSPLSIRSKKLILKNN